MPQPPAHVSSVHAIETFRANLLTYVAKARPVLEDICDEISRAREWLEHDRRPYWENQLRRRRRTLEDAEAALFSARLSNLRDVRSAEQMAAVKARNAMKEAEDKLSRINKWARDFDHLVQPRLKELERLRSLLATDLPRAAIHLSDILKTLEAYATVPPGNPAP